VGPDAQTGPQVVNITFVDPNRHKRMVVDAFVGESVVDVAKRHGVDIHAACGQKLQCATCHVIMQEVHFERLNPPSVREEDMLETSFSLTDTSRLGCQIKIQENMEGMELTLPDRAMRGKVRMTMDHSRPKIDATWNEVPAVFSPAAVREAARKKAEEEQGLPSKANGPSSKIDWEKLFHQERTRAALIERQLKELRAGNLNGLTSKLAQAQEGNSNQKSHKLTEKTTSEGDEDDGTGDLEKLKKELESTIVEGKRAKSTTFDEVVGLEEAKRLLRESILWPALGPSKLFSGIRAKCRGVLLYGPPGCGKTMVARAAAAELCGNAHAATFFHIRPADVMSKFYGDSQKRIAALEELAKERSPAIVFFDEVDTLLGRRDAAHGVAEHHKAVTNALLTWMDGFEQDADRVFFIGATNRADAIDEAALRRFGELVEVGLPDFEQRLALLKSLVSGATKDGHLSDLSDESLRDIAGRTEGMSGDDVSRVVQQAYMEVLRELPDGVHKDLKLEDVPPVTAAHFDHIMNTRVLSSTAMYQNLQKQGHHR